jgi:dolichol-phosphate mannosyltransferase
MGKSHLQMMPGGAARFCAGARPNRSVCAKGFQYAPPTTLNAMSAPIWVVIPTYNEAANVEPIARAVLTELQRLAPGRFRILVVDDNSPDGTGSIADQLATEIAELEVLHRPAKEGLGPAYLAGFGYAMAAGAELLVQMDADFSHDPKYLQSLLDGAQEADLVLGSRYVPGGGVRNWGLVRRALSRGGGIYARTILGVHVRDLTGGFKCLHRRVLERIHLNTVRAAGYVFQIEVTYRALLAGFRIKEVPIVFPDRSAGASKMSTRIAIEAMLLVPLLRRSARAAVAAAPLIDPGRDLAAKDV